MFSDEPVTPREADICPTVVNLLPSNVKFASAFKEPSPFAVVILLLESLSMVMALGANT